MRITATLAVVLLISLGCEDDAQREPPTGPSRSASEQPVERLATPSAKSTICASYERDHADVVTLLSKHPADRSLLARKEATATLIQDVCR